MTLTFTKNFLYAQIHNNQLEDAIITYEKIIKEVTDKSYNAENAYNILGEYFRQNNLEKFKEWISRTEIDKDKRFGPYVEKLKNTLNK
jgi:hypothetical protein